MQKPPFCERAMSRAVNDLMDQRIPQMTFGVPATVIHDFTRYLN
jgi:hypothetical protein